MVTGQLKQFQMDPNGQKYVQICPGLVLRQVSNIYIDDLSCDPRVMLRSEGSDCPMGSHFHIYIYTHNRNKITYEIS